MFRFWFSFLFLRRVFLEPALSAKAEIPTGTRHDLGVFFKPPRAVLY
jgi:hypothetical protein